MLDKAEKNRFKGNSASKSFSRDPEEILLLRQDSNKNASGEFRQERIPFAAKRFSFTAFSRNPQTIPLIFKKVESGTFSEN